MPARRRLGQLALILASLSFLVPAATAEAPPDEEELHELIDEFDTLGLDAENEPEAEVDSPAGGLDLDGMPGEADKTETGRGGWLTPPDPKTFTRRMEIVERIVAIPGRERNGWLLKLLASESNIVPHVTNRVVAELSVSAGEEALPTLQVLLESPHAPTAYSAARVIGHVGGEQAIALLRVALRDKRLLVRIGAIEGLGYSESEDAAPLIEEFLDAANTAEREAARHARRELCWRSGRPMPDPPAAAKEYSIGSAVGYTIAAGPQVNSLEQLRPPAREQAPSTKSDSKRAIVTIGTCAAKLDREFAEKANQDALDALLSRGGIIWIATDTVGPGLHRFLRSAGVPVPGAESSDIGPPELYISPGDPWDAMMWPRNLMHETTLKLHASGFWGRWDEAKQVAPFRSPTNLNHAALIVQTGVLGKGTVVFSKLKQVIANPVGVDAQWHFLDAMSAVVRPHSLAVPGELAVNAEFESPHVPWAKPLAGQKLKVLFAPQASCAREAIEIAQRVDCEYRVVPYRERSNPLHPKYRDSGVLDPEAIVWLQGALGKPWDVLATGSRWVGVGIMCYGNAWHQWPVALRLYVRKKVFREGRGLVVFFDHRAAYADRSFPDLRACFVKDLSGVARTVPDFGPESSASPGELLTVAEIGKGRAVLASRGLPILEGWTVKNPLGSLAFVDPYEYWYALLARAVQFGAGRDGPVRVTEFDLGDLERGKVAVKLTNTERNPVTARAIFRLRNKLNRIETQREMPLQLATSGGGSCIFDFGAIPKACIGEFLALDNHGNVLGWGNCGIPGGAGNAIVELSFDKPRYPLNATITITGKLTRKLAEPGEVRVALTDVYDRVVSKATAPVPAGADRFQCSAPTGLTLSRLVHAEIAVAAGDRPVAGTVQGLLVEVYPRTDFPCYFKGPLASRDQARLLGYDAGGVDVQDALRLGLEYYDASFDVGMHGMMGISGYDPPSLLDRETLNGWSSPKYHLTQWQKAQELGPTKQLAGVRLTMLADEDSGWYNGWHKMGYSPSTLHELRQRLRREYGSLDALNRGWETDFKRWRDVRPMHLAELGGRESVSAWVDHRVFMEWQYAWRRTFSDVMLLKQYVPDAKVGFSTAGDDCGWDLYHMAKAQTAMLFQLGIQQRKYCSWTKPGDLVMTWFGGYQVPPPAEARHEKACRYFPWRALFSGMTGFLMYSDLPGARHGLLRADFSPTWPAHWMGEELREIKAGPAKLLFNAERDLGAIASYYSGPSQFTQMASPSFVKEAKWDYGSEHRFLDLGWQELGWPQRWVAPEEVREGRLMKGDLKILVMSAISALSNEEAEGVRRFVAEGGTLVGTVEVGSRDAHGGAPLKGQLADVFGFEYLPDQPCSTELRKRKVIFEWDGKTYDLGETPTPARPMKVTSAKELSTTWKAGNAPHVLTNEFGKGRAFFLNLSPRALRTFGTWQGERSLEYDQWLFFLRDLAKSAVADPGLEVRRKDSKTLWRVDIAPFRSGRASYYAVMDGVTMFRAGGWTRLDGSAPYQTQDVEIHWGRPGHIYEIRSRRYFGHTNMVELPLRQATALLFAHLPYTITGLTAEAPGTPQRGTPLPIELEVTVSEGPPVDHVCRVEVADPAGKARPEYEDRTLCPDGTGTYVLPLAYNDPVGTWTLRVTEVVSGKATELAVQVR